jgi:hypothetical protein
VKTQPRRGTGSGLRRDTSATSLRFCLGSPRTCGKVWADVRGRWGPGWAPLCSSSGLSKAQSSPSPPCPVTMPQFPHLENPGGDTCPGLFQGATLRLHVTLRTEVQSVSLVLGCTVKRSQMLAHSPSLWDPGEVMSVSEPLFVHGRERVAEDSTRINVPRHRAPESALTLAASPSADRHLFSFILNDCIWGLGCSCSRRIVVTAVSTSSWVCVCACVCARACVRVSGSCCVPGCAHGTLRLLPLPRECWLYRRAPSCPSRELCTGGLPKISFTSATPVCWN